MKTGKRNSALIFLNLQYSWTHPLLAQQEVKQLKLKLKPIYQTQLLCCGGNLNTEMAGLLIHA